MVTIHTPRQQYLKRSRNTLPFRIYISVNGEGFGHSSRCLAIARQFDPESILLGSYGYVLERLQRSGYQTVEIKPEFKIFGEDGSLEFSKTILKNSTWPLIINKLTKEEVKILREYGITCVLSDCRAPAIFAAAKLGLPSIFMTNQTNFDHFFQRWNYSKSSKYLPAIKDSSKLTPTSKTIQEAIVCGAFEPALDMVNKTIFREVDEIIIPDFPPPDTISLPVLSHRPQLKKLQRFVGPLTAWKPEHVIPCTRPGNGPYVVGTLGGHQYRLPLFQALLAAAKLLPHVKFDIFTSFIAEATSNVRILDFTDNPECYYKAADVVVTQAGHSTVMELLSLGKPSILIPDCKQIEQESNAQRMVELNVASQISYPELSGVSLASEIQMHLRNRSFEINALRLARIASSLNGSQTVAEVISEYAKRIIAY